MKECWLLIPVTPTRAFSSMSSNFPRLVRAISHNLITNLLRLHFPPWNDFQSGLYANYHNPLERNNLPSTSDMRDIGFENCSTIY